MKCRTLTSMYYIKVNLCNTSIHYPEYDIYPSNNLQNTGSRNIGHWPTYNNEVNLCVALIHYPTWHSSIKYSWRNMAKIIGPWNIGHWPNIFYEVNLCTILIHHPKYNITTSNSLQDITLNHWTAKNRSQTYIYFMRSIFVSHWCIIPNMTFTQQIILKTLSKVSDLHTYYEVNICVVLIQYLKYDLHISNSLQEVTKSLIEWNISQCDLYLFWGQRLDHTDSLSKRLTSIHQIVFKILRKITQPWNTGHTDLDLMTQKPRSYGWVRVLRPFNSISVISRRWKGEHEKLCAMKRCLGSGRISPPAAFEPPTPWS